MPGHHTHRTPANVLNDSVTETKLTTFHCPVNKKIANHDYCRNKVESEHTTDNFIKEQRNMTYKRTNVANTNWEQLCDIIVKKFTSTITGSGRLITCLQICPGNTHTQCRISAIASLSLVNVQASLSQILVMLCDADAETGYISSQIRHPGQSDRHFPDCQTRHHYGSEELVHTDDISTSKPCSAFTSIPFSQ